MADTSVETAPHALKLDPEPAPALTESAPLNNAALNDAALNDAALNGAALSEQKGEERASPAKRSAMSASSSSSISSSASKRRRGADAGSDASEPLRIAASSATARAAPLAVPAFGSVERVDAAYGDALLIEHYHQGGGSVVHVFPDAIAPTASADLRRRFAKVW